MERCILTGAVFAVLLQQEALDLCFRGALFKLQLEIATLSEVFCDYPQPFYKIADVVPFLHDYFMTNPFQLIFTNHSMLYSLRISIME